MQTSSELVSRFGQQLVSKSSLKCTLKQAAAISWLLLSHAHQTGAYANGAKDYIVNGKITGGVAFVACPEKYGDTGVTTFIIDQRGIVYEKNLGKGHS